MKLGPIRWVSVIAIAAAMIAVEQSAATAETVVRSASKVRMWC